VKVLLPGRCLPRRSIAKAGAPFLTRPIRHTTDSPRRTGRGYSILAFELLACRWLHR